MRRLSHCLPRKMKWNAHLYAHRSVAASDQSTTEAASIAAALERDTLLLEEVVQQMHPENRRRLVVAGGAMEWFGKENVAREVQQADADSDKVISPKDFDKWFETALKRKVGAAQGTSAADISSTDPIPFAAFALIALEAGLPFVGFGFLDNATMIIAGDAIDRSLGFYLNCSVMASAAMGNVVSGCMGMQVHGFIEKVVQRLNLKTPVLSEEQRKSQRVFMAGHVGGTIGIALGLSLGMLPLLLIQDDEEKMQSTIFHSLDRNDDGSISVEELALGLSNLGIQVEQCAVEDLVKRHSGGDALSLDQFKLMCRSLKQSKKVE